MPDPFEKRRNQRLAQARLARRKRRKALLQSRVVVASLLCFALLWGVVFFQLVSSSDPVLGNGTSRGRQGRTAKAAPARPAPETVAEREEAELLAEAEAEIGTEAEAEPEPEPVVTSQS